MPFTFIRLPLTRFGHDFNRAVDDSLFGSLCRIHRIFGQAISIYHRLAAIFKRQLQNLVAHFAACCDVIISNNVDRQSYSTVATTTSGANGL